MSIVSQLNADDLNVFPYIGMYSENRYLCAHQCNGINAIKSEESYNVYNWKLFL